MVVSAETDERHAERDRQEIEEAVIASGEDQDLEERLDAGREMPNASEGHEDEARQRQLNLSRKIPLGKVTGERK